MWKRPGEEAHRISLTPRNKIPSLANRIKQRIRACLVHKGPLTFYTFIKPTRMHKTTIIAAELPFPRSPMPQG